MKSDKLTRPWAYTPSQFIEGMLFHGSSEPWLDPMPRPGGYDSCFWTANTPLIAQVYIPDWGGKSMISIPHSMLDEQVRPSDYDFAWKIAEQLGARAEILERDASGRATSWRSLGAAITNRDVVDRLQGMGYESNVEYSFAAWIKTIEQGIPVRKDATPYGRLVMLDPSPDVKVFSLSDDGEGDLSDPQYHKIQTFQGAFQAGFDMVKIGDHCQSPRWGNVGHEAWGFSAASVQAHFEQGRTLSIAATHRDWGESLRVDLTPDIVHWHFGQVAQALIAGEDVPREVLRAHAVLLEDFSNTDSNLTLLTQITLDSATYQSPVGAKWREELVQDLQARIKRADKFTEITVSLFPNLERSDCRVELEASLVEACRREGVVLPAFGCLSQPDGSPVQVGDLKQRVVDCVYPTDKSTPAASPRGYVSAPG